MDLVPKELRPDSEQHDLKKVRKEQYVQTQHRIKGHKLWKFNPHTGDLEEIPYPESTVKLNTTNKPLERGAVAKQYVDEDLMYFQSLNRKNAIRKLTNRGYGVRKDTR